ncbi:hypothetical protein GUJ93_ZPchr0001g29908 [Zizania palustris]|uniref:Uncharacterized protein n=1 Tax=Zizania palustris TaxID=103762 RepID=A0A8J5VD73_ZIZPA|nr:hypothetical protein GUJ93_ZPchr0001g29908 [Zizania palustris]
MAIGLTNVYGLVKLKDARSPPLGSGATSGLFTGRYAMQVNSHTRHVDCSLPVRVHAGDGWFEGFSRVAAIHCLMRVAANSELRAIALKSGALFLI